MEAAAAGAALVAYQNATTVGATVLEMDARATQDGVVILCHDNSLDRTSDGAGLIKNKTYAELLELDAGYQYTPDGGATYPYRGQGVTFATLLEVLQAFPQQLFAIEIKEPEITEDVLAIINEAGVADRVIVAAFSDAVVLQVRQLEPDMLTALTVTESVELGRLTDEQEASYRQPAWVLQSPPDFGELILDQEFISRAARVHIKTHVWTINKADEMQDFIDMGISGIMTDDPETLQGLID